MLFMPGMAALEQNYEGRFMADICLHVIRIEAAQAEGDFARHQETLPDPMRTVRLWESRRSTFGFRGVPLIGKVERMRRRVKRRQGEGDRR